MDKEKIEITLENCEAYCKLHRAYFFNQSEINRIYESTIEGLIVTGATFSTAFILALAGVLGNSLAAPVVVGILVTSGIATPMIAAYVQGAIIKRKNKVAVASEYPDIDINISLDELELTLAKEGILKYKHNEDGDIYRSYDITGYKNYIKSKQVKDKMIEEDAHKSLKNNFSIADEQLEKAKIKVKTMIRK